MLYLFVTRKHAYTFSIFMAEWASPEFKRKAQIIPYDSLPLIRDILPGTFIFSDLERLNGLQLQLLEDFCDQLAAADEHIPVINHPRSVLSRFDLLRALYDSGLNSYNAYPAGDRDCQPRYPIFLRMDNNHKGPLSGLLADSVQRDAKILHAAMQGFEIHHMLQVEFCETRSEDGFYRKYSAFRFGDRIIPGHVIFDMNWVAKDAVPPDESKKQEGVRYLQENPHAEEIFAIFELAGITYGRIDYSMRGNRAQTWEINTNPLLIKPRKEYPDDIVKIKVQLVGRLEEGLLAMDYGGDSASGGDRPDRKIPVHWDAGKYLS